MIQRLVAILTITSILFGLGACSTMNEYEAKRKAALKSERLAKNAIHKPTTSEPDPKATPAVQDPFAGLKIPELVARVETADQLDFILKKYGDFSVSSAYVVRQVQAYGLKTSLPSVQQMRVASFFWNDYFSSMQILPEKPSILKNQVLAFYTKLSDIDKANKESVEALNKLVDKDRTRPWSAGKSQ